ncbi:MAG: beta-propeller fold lactonase family protein [Planctomycetia bacterium]|nr:beta-propeller fold lactonase family protein [Planctomycetia bacterium]
MFRLFSGLFILVYLFFGGETAWSQKTCIYVATESESPETEGIYVLEWDAATGTLSAPRRVGETGSLSLLIPAHDFQNFYGITENGKNLVALARDGEGRPDLTLKNNLAEEGGKLAALCLDATQRHLWCLDVGQGELIWVTVLEDGTLGEVVHRQKWDGKTPEGNFEGSLGVWKNGRLYLCDGVTEKIWIYRPDMEKQVLAANEPAVVALEKGETVGKLVFHPQLPWVFGVEPAAGRIFSFRLQNDGGLEKIATVSLSESQPTSAGKNVGDIQLSPDGEYLYVAHGGNDSITVFHVEENGQLKEVMKESSQGEQPLALGMDVSGAALWVANRSGKVVLFQVDEATGALKASGKAYDLPATPLGMVCTEERSLGALEQLEEMTLPKQVPEWESNRTFPWNKYPAGLKSLTASEQVQTIILARVKATTMQHLRKVVAMCTMALENPIQKENAHFLRLLAESAIFQQAISVLDHLEGLSEKDLKNMRPILETLGRDLNLKKALEWNPTSPAGNIYYARLLSFLSQVSDSKEASTENILKHLNTGIENCTGNDAVMNALLASALVLRGTLTAQKDMETALKDLERAATLNPAIQEKVWQTRMSWYLAAQKLDQALKELDEEIAKVEKEGEDESGQSLGDLKRLKIFVYDEQKEYEKALVLVRELLQENPDEEELQLSELQLLMSLQRTEECIQAVSKLLDKNPLNANYYFLRAKLYHLEENWEKALEDWNKTLLFSPGNKEAQTLKWFTLVKLNRTEEAVAEVEKLLKLDPKNFALAMQLASIYLEAKQYARVAEQLDKVEKDFDLESLLRTVTEPAPKPEKEAPKENEDELPGLEDTEAELSEDALQNALLLYEMRANFRLLAGKQKESIADYEKVLALAPENEVALNNLAWILGTSPEDSLRNAERAIALGTKVCELTQYANPGYLSTLAAAYAEKGDFEKALEWIQKALEIAEKNQDETLDALKKEKAAYEKKEPFREKMEDYRY